VFLLLLPTYALLSVCVYPKRLGPAMALRLYRPLLEQDEVESVYLMVGKSKEAKIESTKDKTNKHNTTCGSNRFEFTPFDDTGVYY